jgi:hypothetical protein
LLAIEIDILDPQAASLHQPQACAVHEAADDSLRARFDSVEDLRDLGGREDDREFRGSFCPGGIDFDLGLEDFPVQEEKGREGLVLGAGRYLSFDGKMGQEVVDGGVPQFEWVAPFTLFISMEDRYLEIQPT